MIMVMILGEYFLISLGGGRAAAARRYRGYWYTFPLHNQLHTGLMGGVIEIINKSSSSSSSSLLSFS